MDNSTDASPEQRAQYERAWQALEDAERSGRSISGRVIEKVEGGLILDVGLRGYLPASLINDEAPTDLDSYLGTELRCKVIEVDPQRHNIVLSRRATMEDEG